VSITMIILIANAEMSGPTHNEGRRVSPGCYALDAPSICSGGANQRGARANR